MALGHLQVSQVSQVPQEPKLGRWGGVGVLENKEGSSVLLLGASNATLLPQCVASVHLSGSTVAPCSRPGV